MVVNQTTAEKRVQAFDEFIAQSELPVLVDFWADWCGPCHALAPVLGQAAKDFAGKIVVIKVDVDAKPHVAAKYQIQSIPTLILFENGIQIWRQSGALSYYSLAEELHRHVG